MSLVCREKSQQNVSSNILNMPLRGSEKIIMRKGLGKRGEKCVDYAVNRLDYVEITTVMKSFLWYLVTSISLYSFP